jgi:hypothetical protein
MRSTKLEALLGSERTGKVLGSLLVAALLALLLLPAIARPAHAVSTFTVNRTDDLADSNLADNTCDTLGLLGSQCSLRAAIQQANATANSGGPDLIHFAIRGPAGVVRTISPTSELPDITQPVTVDGYTQTGSSVNTATSGTNAVLLIELNGANMVQGNGFTITGGGTTIRGLVINRFKDESDGLFDGCGIFLPNLAPNTNNVIEGNFIGTDPSGTVDLGNELPGVLSFNQSIGNTIGGADLQDRNLISGNGGDGVAADSSENTVQKNLIGTDRNGTADLGNSGSGVEVSGAGNLVTENRIAFNGKDGFSDGVTVFSGTGNRILRNSIFSNAGLGIDLVVNSFTFGPTANDPKDPDTGPNNLQNKPVLDSAITSGGSTSIAGRLNSTPQKTFTIQYFSNPSGNEGKKFLGQKSVTTNANGITGTFAFNPAQAVAVGDTVTATATQAGNTSEFSAPRTVASS